MEDRNVVVMNTKKIAWALLAYVVATLTSVVVFGGQGIGLAVDLALLLAFFYYLALLGRRDSLASVNRSP